MKKIQMVDLKSQYDFIEKEVTENMSQVFETSAFINGPMVQAFQADMEAYLNVKHVIPCANGTDALQIALMGLKLVPGDEVITSDFTFAATVEVISLLKLKPVLVDVDPQTFNIDPLAIEKAITPKTKAIIPVHLFGQSAAMDSILEIANKHNLYVVEDNAQGIGATHTFSDGKKAKTGTLGHVSATSFFPSKNLGAYGDGGAIFTNDDALAHFIRGIVNHGMYQRYYHDVVGVNSRLDALQAAVLKVKLQYLDFYNERRKEAANRYDQYFKNHANLIIPHRAADCDSHVFHQYTLRVLNSDRDALVVHLNKNNIPCGVYYPVPLHAQKAYADDQVDSRNFPITNQLVKEVISLPMHSELTHDQIDYIATTLLQFFN
ncbi:MAG: DegT/DnrJ/EryC1/StrS family aminotransferase [Flavobacteriaceae bacterium]|jgi:dTDP-4-amino-4,6-dideoxygalactose transaminase|nr:DegT/DnrJ/EryC1/StrS family aminotransferase [Flavobacteriaceae bacterium]MDG2386220.1 DegT/DnrJ/EryC1/StrS family aminotransferase [Flavobacteriaceae bacterium]